MHAHHRLGVPVHEAPGDRGPLRRVPDGTEVTLRAEIGENWLEVAFDDGTRGFVTRRYTQPSAPRAPGKASKKVARDAAAICARARARRAEAPAGARVATFNVRWFPDGVPGKKAPAGGGTDLELLACSIAETGAEVVLVQEFKTNDRADASLTTVLRALDGLTGGTWQARFDACPIETAQHVGLLFDARRAEALGAPRTIAELNPLGGACTGSLRPGLAQRFRLSSGQHADVVSVHFKSGDDARSFDLRQRTLAALGRLPLTSGDVRIIGGDLNTMGCSECSERHSAAAERRQARARAAAAGFTLVDPKGGCSHYYRGQPGLLDGFLLAGHHRGRTEVAGVCADLACSALPAGQDLGASSRVSDHCPLVLSLDPP